MEQYSSLSNSLILADVVPKTNAVIDRSDELDELIEETKQSFESTGILFESVSHALSVIHSPIERNKYILAIEKEFDHVISQPIYKPFREFFRSEREKNDLAISSSAYFDSLTGGIRKDHYNEQMTSVFKTALREKKPFTLIYLDLDFFKAINDKRGHHVGDLVLTSIGKIIVTQLRASDIFIRNGGEEFAIILPNTNTIYAKLILKRIQNNISKHKFVDTNKNEFNVTTSCGVVTILPTKEKISSEKLNSHFIQEKLNEISKLADLLLYEVKGNGRDGYAIYELHDLFKSHNLTNEDVETSSSVFIKTSTYSGPLDRIKKQTFFKQMMSKLNFND